MVTWFGIKLCWAGVAVCTRPSSRWKCQSWFDSKCRASMFAAGVIFLLTWKHGLQSTVFLRQISAGFEPHTWPGFGCNELAKDNHSRKKILVSAWVWRSYMYIIVKHPHRAPPSKWATGCGLSTRQFQIQLQRRCNSLQRITLPDDLTSTWRISRTFTPGHQF